MKEDSIEEDIKNINKGLYELADSYELYHASWAKRIFESIKEKLNHILSDYKRVLKENEELKKYKEYYSSARQLVDNNYIQKQKVKEVIKELEDNIYRIKKQYSNGGENCNTVYLENLAQVKILKQILKEVE